MPPSDFTPPRAPRWQRGQHLVTALVTLCALVGVLTGVSLTRVAAIDRDIDALEARVWPSLDAVHGLTRLVDEARGMEALLLLTDDGRERAAVEARLQRQRVRIETRLAQQSTLAVNDEADQRIAGEVRAALKGWWSVQDRVVDASRHADADPAAAKQGRALLAGDSQRAYRHLLDRLEAWWRYHDDMSTWALKKARGTLALTKALVGAAAALALLTFAVALRIARPARAGASAAPRVERRAVPRGAALPDRPAAPRPDAVARDVLVHAARPATRPTDVGAAQGVGARDEAPTRTCATAACDVQPKRVDGCAR